MTRWTVTPILVCALVACSGHGHGTGDDADTDEDAGDVDDGADPGQDSTPAVSPPTLELTATSISLTPVAMDAVALAPDWLQDDLAMNLARLETMYQNEMSGLLVDLDDPDLTDEVAFVIAHTSPEVLEHPWFFSELILENARLVYEYDLLLDYVRIDDVGVPGVDPDYFTTLTYSVETATGTQELTIDPLVYYWYVVHPRLEDEMPWYVDGWASGDAVRPDLGWFWREFLWDAAAAGCPGGRTCPLLSEQMPGIEVAKRLAEGSVHAFDAQEQVYSFVEEVLDFGAGTERPTQPNRIYAVACGNCGEYADFTVAALRTSLIPARNCGASSNDHTWAEWWYEGDDWHGETWFYKGGVRRDLADNDCDGIADDGLDGTDADADGFTIAAGDCDDTRTDVYPDAPDPLLSSNRLYAITTTRGDTLLGTDRTGAYATLPSFLQFDILDLSGRGVDGAIIDIYGTWEVYGYPDQWAGASEVVTDVEGKASITVGELNPYGYAVRSAIGDTPGEGHLFVAVDRTEPLATYPVIRNVPGDMPGPPGVTVADLTAGADPELTISFSFGVQSYRVTGDGRHFGSFSSEHDGGRIDAFLLDPGGYALFVAGEPFEAQWSSLGTGEGEASLDLPRTGPWILVLSNLAFVRSTMVGSLSVHASPFGDVLWTGAGPTLDHRFRIPPGQHVAVTLVP